MRVYKQEGDAFPSQILEHKEVAEPGGAPRAQAVRQLSNTKTIR